MKLFEEWISLLLNVLRIYILISYQIFVIVNYRVRMAYCFSSLFNWPSFRKLLHFWPSPPRRSLCDCHPTHTVRSL